MSTTILTDEQIETLFREHDDLYAFCHAIAAAVLQSEQVQARMEAYAAAKVREAPQWQPIETAPKDGTAILIGNEDGTWIAKYVPFYPSGCRAKNPWFSLMLNHDHMRKGKPFGPTHWMPLPATPQQ